MEVLAQGCFRLAETRLTIAALAIKDEVRIGDKWVDFRGEVMSLAIRSHEASGRREGMMLQSFGSYT